VLKRDELPSTGKFGDRYELLPIPAFTLKDSLDLEDKVEVKGGDLIQFHTSHPSPTRSSAVKNGIRGCSGSTHEL